MCMKPGNTSEINYLESQLEELQLRNDLPSAEADATAARFAMRTLLKHESGQVTLIPRSAPNASTHDYQLL